MGTVALVGKDAPGQPHNHTEMPWKISPDFCHVLERCFLAAASLIGPLFPQIGVCMYSLYLHSFKLSSIRVMPLACGFWPPVSLEVRNSESLPPSNLRLSPSSRGALQTRPQSLPPPLSQEKPPWQSTHSRRCHHSLSCMRYKHPQECCAQIAGPCRQAGAAALKTPCRPLSVFTSWGKTPEGRVREPLYTLSSSSPGRHLAGGSYPTICHSDSI